MAAGTDMMLQAAIKLILSQFKIDPEMVKKNIAEAVQIMADHKAQQQAIIDDLAAIKLKLGIAEKDGPNGQNLGRIGSDQATLGGSGKPANA